MIGYIEGTHHVSRQLYIEVVLPSFLTLDELEKSVRLIKLFAIGIKPPGLTYG